MNKDQKFLAEMYEQVAANVSNFEAKIKSRADNNSYVFGMTPEGKKYAVIEEYDKYDDGDRWIEEVNYYYEVEGENGKYISDALGKELFKKSYGEYSEMNKHVSPEVMKYRQ